MYSIGAMGGLVSWIRRNTCPKETFPLSAQLGGKAKQQGACKGLNESPCLEWRDGQGFIRFTNLSTLRMAFKQA